MAPLILRFWNVDNTMLIGHIYTCFHEETVQAALDLKAQVLMPVHWGKYTLAMHDWNEPVNRVVKAAKESGLKITTPKLGEKVDSWPCIIPPRNGGCLLRK